MTPCPRCGSENPSSAAACGRCGAPLALFEEPSPSRLDAELDLDRRSRTPAPVVPDEAPAPALDPGRSDWRLRSPEEAAALAELEGEATAAPPARRALAWAIDGALLAAVAAAIPSVVGAFADPRPTGPGFAAALALSEAFTIVVAFVYLTVAHALAGATLGKRVAGIRVVGLDGLRPSPGVSAARSAFIALSLAPLGVGLLPALLSPSRRALHDLLAGTRVVTRP